MKPPNQSLFTTRSGVIPASPQVLPHPVAESRPPSQRLRIRPSRPGGAWMHVSFVAGLTAVFAAFLLIPDAAAAAQDTQALGDNKKPEAAPVVASPVVAATPVTAVPTDAAAAVKPSTAVAVPGSDTNTASTNADEIQLSLQGANVDMVVQWLAQTTGKTVIKHPRVQCQLTITSSKKMTKREAIDLVYRALILGRFYRHGIQQRDPAYA